MKVRDVMTVNPSIAEMESTIEEIATIMKEEDVGAIPILDEDGELVGIVTDRDIVVCCIAEGHDPSECKAEDIIKMHLQINGGRMHIAYPEMELADAGRLMAQHHIRRLPVVKSGKLAGMLSLRDVAAKKARQGKVVPVREAKGIRKRTAAARSSKRKKAS